MNANRLLAHYERIADTPDAILRLRRLILDLAVRGRLVPQNPNDEPSSELLKRIEKEKVSRADLPEGWRRATVGALLNFQYGKGLKASERKDKGPVPVFGSNGIVGFTDEPLTVQPSIIVGRKGSAGALNLCDGPSWTTDVAFFVEAPGFFEIRFLLSALTALDLGKLAKGVKPGLSRSDAYEQFLCIPPLAEQNRIVAKVDELMALCDRLEAARADREATRDRLTAASLARLNAPDPQTFQDDARFVLDALPTLTARPDQIKQLRQTILNLAVRGKLVEQEMAEQPTASPPAQSAELEGRLEIEIPANWRWVRVEDVAIARLGKMLDKAKNKGRLRPYLRNTNVHWFEIRLDDLKSIALEDDEFEEYRLKKGDILICEGGHGIGRTAVWNGEEQNLVFQKALHRVRPGPCLDPHYFAQCCFVYFDAEVMQTYFTGVGIPHFTGRGLAKLVFPLPPLAEQHRIVAKVDELMALCDRLEASLVAGDDTRRRLLEALLAEALSPALTIDREAAE
jgi:type I restriction enzyme S subunit